MDFSTKKGVNLNFNAKLEINLWRLNSVLLLYCRALQEQIEISGDEQSQEVSSTENVVRVRVLHEDFKPMMAASIQELRRAG